MEMKASTGSKKNLMQQDESENDDEVYEEYVTRYAVYSKKRHTDNKIKNGSNIKWLKPLVVILILSVAGLGVRLVMTFLGPPSTPITTTTSTTTATTTSTTTSTTTMKQLSPIALLAPATAQGPTILKFQEFDVRLESRKNDGIYEKKYEKLPINATGN